MSVPLKDGKREIDLEELYAAYPEAVRLSPGFAPIGPLRLVATPALLSGTYTLPLGEGFVEGDTIRVIVGGAVVQLEIAMMFGEDALVKSPVELGAVTVTGKKVPNVKSADQGQLLLAAIDMINRVHEEMDDLRAKNAILEERLRALEPLERKPSRPTRK